MYELQSRLVVTYIHCSNVVFIQVIFLIGCLVCDELHINAEFRNILT